MTVNENVRMENIAGKWMLMNTADGMVSFAPSLTPKRSATSVKARVAAIFCGIILKTYLYKDFFINFVFKFSDFTFRRDFESYVDIY